MADGKSHWEKQLDYELLPLKAIPYSQTSYCHAHEVIVPFEALDMYGWTAIERSLGYMDDAANGWRTGNW